MAKKSQNYKSKEQTTVATGYCLELVTIYLPVLMHWLLFFSLCNGAWRFNRNTAVASKLRLSKYQYFNTALLSEYNHNCYYQRYNFFFFYRLTEKLFNVENNNSLCTRMHTKAMKNTCFLIIIQCICILTICKMALLSNDVGVFFMSTMY